MHFETIKAYLTHYEIRYGNPRESRTDLGARDFRCLLISSSRKSVLSIGAVLVDFLFRCQQLST